MSKFLLTAYFAQLATCLCMTGLIWFVQVVHYPLMGNVPSDVFIYYEEQHATRTSWVVMPLMLLELGATVTCVALDRRPAFVLASFLLFACWASTFFIQVPLHNQLANGFDLSAIHRLVATNWIRTIAWTVRSVVLLGVAYGFRSS